MGVIRRTKSVKALLKEFDSVSGAIAATTLVQNLDNEFNKTTVYRVLDRLEDDGVLHSFLGKNGIKWYAKCNGCTGSQHLDVHPHFQCLTCGKVDCLDVEIKIPVLPNREIKSSQILIQGNCETCVTTQ